MNGSTAKLIRKKCAQRGLSRRAYRVVKRAYTRDPAKQKAIATAAWRRDLGSDD